VQDSVTPPLHQCPPLAKDVPVVPLVNPHPMTTRVKRDFWLPADKLTLSATLALDLSPVPSSICIALVEFVPLIANNTSDLVPRPVGSNIATDKWIFKHKFNFHSSLKWYKAHWVLHSDPVSTMMKPSARWSSQPRSAWCTAPSRRPSIVASLLDLLIMHSPIASAFSTSLCMG
jgi:hypothetical protein